MKKYLFTLLTIFLILPITVFADEPKVLTLETEVSGNAVTFNGTVESGSHAVMCKLYDASNHEKDMLSVAVNNGAFEGSFKITETGNYKVACANYEGGAVKSDTTTVNEVVADSYTVSFNTNGGSAIADLRVAAGATLEAPDWPEKDGFVFGGWYADNTLSIEFDFETPITNNTTLYAKWVDALVIHTIITSDGGTYLVDYYTVGTGNEGPIAEQLNHSAMYVIGAGSPMMLVATTNEGFRFVGWYRVHEEDADGQGHMEWRLDEKLSSNAEFRFTPTENVYVSPIFESENQGPETFMVEFVTNSDMFIPPVEVERDGVVPVPENPNKEGFVFAGWYEDDTLNVEFDFETRINNDLTLYAKWDEEDDTGKQTYNVPDADGNSISFKEEEGHEFSFAMLDLSKLTDEELLELTDGEVNKEQYDEALNVLKEAVSDEGTFIAIYEIIVVDENDDSKNRGPFDIKIFMTEEMKQYDSYKLLYVDTDNNFHVEEIIDLSVDDDGYITGRLEHLSSYVLVGNTTAPATNNPKTFDNIYVWIIGLIISLIGLSAGMITYKKIKR